MANTRDFQFYSLFNVVDIGKTFEVFLKENCGKEGMPFSYLGDSDKKYDILSKDNNYVKSRIVFVVNKIYDTIHKIYYNGISYNVDKTLQSFIDVLDTINFDKTAKTFEAKYNTETDSIEIFIKKHYYNINNIKKEYKLQTHLSIDNLTGTQEQLYSINNRQIDFMEYEKAKTDLLLDSRANEKLMVSYRIDNNVLVKVNGYKSTPIKSMDFDKYNNYTNLGLLQKMQQYPKLLGILIEFNNQSEFISTIKDNDDILGEFTKKEIQLLTDIKNSSDRIIYDNEELYLYYKDRYCKKVL